MSQTLETPEVLTSTVTSLAPTWNVVVYNDPVNLFTYVIYVLKALFGFNDTEAKQKTLDVHQKGKSIVWSGGREEGEHYVSLLLDYGLTAKLESVEP